MAHKERVWIVRDEIVGAQGLACQANLCLAPGLVAERVDGPRPGVRVQDAEGHAFLILAMSDSAARMRLEPCTVAPSYGREVPSTAVQWNWASGAGSEIALLLEDECLGSAQRRVDVAANRLAAALAGEDALRGGGQRISVAQRNCDSGLGMASA